MFDGWIDCMRDIFLFLEKKNVECMLTIPSSFNHCRYNINRLIFLQNIQTYCDDISLALANKNIIQSMNGINEFI